MIIYYTYNQTIIGFCAPSSQMQVKDSSYPFITQNFKIQIINNCQNKYS